MSLDNPGPEIRQAIRAGVRWFERSRIEGIRQTQRDGDKVLVTDESAPPLWPRFSEIGTNRPIFCGRDGVIRYDIAQIEPERRNGYAWYGTWGSDVATRYSRWKARLGSRRGRSGSMRCSARRRESVPAWPALTLMIRRNICQDLVPEEQRPRDESLSFE